MSPHIKQYHCNSVEGSTNLEMHACVYIVDRAITLWFENINGSPIRPKLSWPTVLDLVSTQSQA